MGTPKTRKMRVRVCEKCGRSQTIRADNASSICRACATRLQNAEKKVGKRNLKHGMTGTAIHHTWRSMIQRCTNSRNHHYPFYGGRGITVCKRWLEFKNFYKDMGDKPYGYSIHRVNNDKGYEPGNCVYMSPHEHNKLHSS
jgi:hypothetical protein